MNLTRTLVFLLFFSVTSLSADTRRVYLGSMDLAGLVPAELPPPGSVMRLCDPEQPARSETGSALGYAPVLFRQPLAAMLAEDLEIRLEVDHCYSNPRPGKFLRVTVWADTNDLSLIHPLIYHIPIHSDQDLGGYE